jgi:UDP-N-acetylmuramoyl-L-alanyl-D-glutamate--2,6-diaminopimelate ligase
MQLKALLDKLEYRTLQGDDKGFVTELVYDSSKVCEGSVFVCICGAKRDGHDFISEVIEKGAKAIIVQKQIQVPGSITVIEVEDTRKALAYMSAAYFDYPAKKLKTIGITGTKGKTTTSYMVKAILEEAGYKTGLIGTIETIIGNKVMPAKNTTPESYVVQKTFYEMVEAGCECVVMEVSSQGLKYNRVAGFTFDLGVFTNLQSDHIGPNEHTDMDDYIRSKGLLFQQCKQGILNLDDQYFDEILKDHTCQIETFGFSDKADLQAKSPTLLYEAGYLGIHYEVKGLMNFSVDIDIPGKFSVYNSLTAVAICRHFNIKEKVMIKALNTVKVKGRVELIPVSDHYTLMIDYAHNAMSLESLLSTLREYKPKRLISLFGCGGNRSKLRRYEMGEVSSNLADLTVVTSDNPRDEEPQNIIDDIIIGVKKGPGKFVAITDRKEAIAYCMKNAQEGDVIVLAGKGHEDYIEVKGKIYKMDERDLIKEILMDEVE